MKKYTLLKVMIVLLGITLFSSCTNDDNTTENSDAIEIKEVENSTDDEEVTKNVDIKVQKDYEANLREIYLELYKKFLSTTYGYEDELIIDGESSKTGVIYDFDGDGQGELLTFYVINNEGADYVGYSYDIYDNMNKNIENANLGDDSQNVICTSYVDESGYNISTVNKEFIFISNKGYIIHRVKELGYGYKVIEYNDGVMKEIDYISFTDASEEPIYFRNEKDSEPKEISREEYEELSIEYGIYDVEKIIMIDDAEGNYTPDSSKIPYKVFVCEMVADNEMDMAIR